jgi:hypothetical protein
VMLQLSRGIASSQQNSVQHKLALYYWAEPSVLMQAEVLMSAPCVGVSECQVAATRYPAQPRCAPAYAHQSMVFMLVVGVLLCS